MGGGSGLPSGDTHTHNKETVYKNSVKSLYPPFTNIKRSGKYDICTAEILMEECRKLKKYGEFVLI